MQESVQRALAGQLGIRQDQAEEMILVLCRHLREQITPDHPVHVAGLGTFGLEGGTITYMPDPRFQAEMAGEMAGLLPHSFAPKRTSLRTRVRVAIVAAIVVISAAGAWWTLQRSPTEEGPIAPFGAIDSATVATELDPDSEASDASMTPTDTLSTISSVESAGADASDTTLSSAQPEILNRLDRSQGGYTLIVASFQEESVAQTVALEYGSTLGKVPVGVLYNAGDEFYRVAVGQVQTIPEALELKESLSALPEDAWVLRIY